MMNRPIVNHSPCLARVRDANGSPFTILDDSTFVAVNKEMVTADFDDIMSTESDSQMQVHLELDPLNNTQLCDIYDNNDVDVYLVTADQSFRQPLPASFTVQEPPTSLAISSVEAKSHIMSTSDLMVNCIVHLILVDDIDSTVLIWFSSLNASVFNE